MLRKRVTELVAIMGVTLMSNCTNTGQVKTSESKETPALVNFDLTECLSNLDEEISCSLKPDQVLELKDTKGALSNGFGVEEICGDRMVVANNHAVCLYELPSGRLLMDVGSPRAMSGAVFAGNDESLLIFKNSWQDNVTTASQYGVGNEATQTVRRPLYGDIDFESDSSFIATNARGFAGGQVCLYRLNNRLEAVDSVPLPLRMQPQQDHFYVIYPLKQDGKGLNVFLNDTVYEVSFAGGAHPIVALDFGDKKVPEDLTIRRVGNAQDYFKALEPYIDLQFIDKFGDYLFCRFENGGNVYNCIFDCESGKMAYSRKGEEGSWGISLDINGHTLCSWPVAIWQDNLLFVVPADVMNRITGENGVNPGIAMLPMEALKAKLKK